MRWRPAAEPLDPCHLSNDLWVLMAFRLGSPGETIWVYELKRAPSAMVILREQGPPRADSDRHWWAFVPEPPWAKVSP